ncbi:hypothetical protein DUNSADRAFT_10504 [Dunaliella salina]|uniref:Methyltransferase domain-containing protein n=1 Tax=Dunaliella salina TaxID=3046 RepID=A0ABQ7FST9_DUNSA|nr:hypothetical protein DUNSADRAFT_10504 [Dunaliella salina]|eukprot:KAF5825407.1 hypothetical protein DUNSADRAFT_10504 [Dunaliella salina]
MLDLPIAEIKHTAWNADVYEPSDDTFLLVDALLQDVVTWSDFNNGAPTVLELGCGSGYISCSLALMMQHMCMHAQMLAIDHSCAAVEATCQTLQNHKVSRPCGSRVSLRGFAVFIIYFG